jgi:hypothetical protein
MKRLEGEQLLGSSSQEGLSGVVYATVMKPDHVGQPAWA